MNISGEGIKFIEREEGTRNTAYHDSRGLLTVGVGHLVQPSDDIHFGDSITDMQVDEFLKDDLAWVEGAIAAHVTATLTQAQYDAVCSLVFNIGGANFSHSTVLRDLNAGDTGAAAQAFLMWKRAGSNPNELLARRQREAHLFLTGEYITNE